MRRSQVMSATALIGVLGVTLTACSTPAAPGAAETEEISQAQIDEAMQTPTTLDFWSWIPGIEPEIERFEAMYPEIDVRVSNQGGASAQYPKLRAAIESGDVPDVAQIEYSFLPSFTITGSVLDLTPYGVAELGDTFVTSAWGQVAYSDAVWGLPQDVGPTGQLYREDIFTQAGVDVPETWDDYEAAAVAIKEATGGYITNLPGNSFSPILALMWQAGARPFGFDGDKTVTIDLESEEATQVIEFWSGLIEKDLIDTAPHLDDNWYQSMSSGKYASWLAAAWGPIFLQGTAANTAGLWRATSLPQWDAAAPASGNQGGSANVVMKDADAAIAAAEFVKFLNSDEESTTRLATELFLFPPSAAVQELPAFRDQESEFYGGQKVNETFAEISTTVEPDWQWLPYNDFASASFKETLGAAIAEKGDLAAGLQAWKEELVTYGESQGFTVVAD